MMRPSEDLFRLIKSLSKSEKRFFKLSSTLQSGDKNYIKLFDAIDLLTEYDEELLKETFKGENFIKHLPSEKNHLYKLILRSLRLFYSENTIGAQLADYIQSIEILYIKALYPECSKMVKRAKRLAYTHERFYYLFELIKWEKQLLEEEYQEGNFDRDLNKVIEEEKNVIQKLRNLAEYQVLYSKINYVFRQGGYARNDKDRQIVSEILDYHLIREKNTALSKRAAATCYYIKGLCAITNHEVEESFQYFSKVVNIFENNPHLIQDIPKQYIKSLGNLFYYYMEAGAFQKLFELIEKMRSFQEMPGFNTMGIRVSIFTSTYYFETMAYERMGRYEEALALVNTISSGLESLGGEISKEDEVLFNYLFANVYFGLGQFKNALKYVNLVLNQSEVKLRQDILSFARLLNLLVHFELGNFDLLDYLLKSTERIIEKRKKTFGREYAFETILLKHFKKLIKPQDSKNKHEETFRELSIALHNVLIDQNEKVALEYFDFLSWVESKVQDRSFAEIKRKKMEGMAQSNAALPELQA